MSIEGEDYRVKNAGEGRAFCLPGRSVEEIAADAAMKGKVGRKSLREPSR
jgi:hypothetical protein